MDSLWQRTPTPKQLRDFGVTVGLALITLGAISFWRHPARHLYPYLWAIGALLVIGGLSLPRALKLPYQLWMAFAFVLGIVMTNVILTVTFFVAFTLVGLLMRAMRRDPLQMKWPPVGERSYWRQREVLPVRERYLRPF